MRDESPVDHSKLAVMSVSIVSAAIMITIGAYTFMPRDHDGTVLGTSWVHRSTQEVFTETLDEEWAMYLNVHPPRMPVNGEGEDPGCWDVHDCHRRWHHDDRYPCGTHRVCTGSGESRRCSNRTEWCSRPIYREWCSYRTMQWVPTVSAETAGASPRESGEMPWPTLPAVDNARELREKTYTLSIQYGTELHDRRLEDETGVRSWWPGDRVSVRTVAGFVWDVSWLGRGQ